MTSLPPADLHRKSTKGKIALKYLTAVKTPGSSIQLQTFVRRCRIETSRLLVANIQCRSFKDWYPKSDEGKGDSNDSSRGYVFVSFYYSLPLS